MYKVLGTILIVGGIALGAYVGIWICFIGGIIDMVIAIRADVLSAPDIACGIGKIMLSGLAGWLSAFTLILPGIALAKK